MRWNLRENRNQAGGMPSHALTAAVSTTNQKKACEAHLLGHSCRWGTTDMTDKTYSTALAGLAIKNTPEPKNITFPDGSQLSFPVSGKASFSGDVEDSAKVFFFAVLRHRDTQLEAERQRADEYRDCIRVLADKLSVNALPNEII